MHRERLGFRRGGCPKKQVSVVPARRVPQCPRAEGVGPPILSAAAAHPETACARTCPRDLARVCPPPLPFSGPHVEAPASAGGDSEGDLQVGGGPVEGPKRCIPARRDRKAAVTVEPRTKPPARPRPASSPGSLLAPTPLTGRARPSLATSLRVGLSGAVGRGGRRQLVRFDDHDGGSRRPAQLSALPAAPLTQVP